MHSRSCALLLCLAGIACAWGLTAHVAFAEDAPAKPKYPTQADLYKDCSPGHRIEFVFPTATLYIDFRWLGSITKIILVEAYGAHCPTWPVKLNGLDFGAVWLPIDIHSGLGQKLIRLGVGSSAQRPPQPRDPQPVAPADCHPPCVEDLTKSPPRKGVFGPGTPDPLVRIYRLHHVAERGSDASVDIVCGGHPGHNAVGLRGCVTSPGYTFHGLSIGYDLSQTDLPMPEGMDITSTDSATEPGALLEFDTRLRAWISGLEQRPEK
jgi:hypothetical protein